MHVFIFSHNTHLAVQPLNAVECQLLSAGMMGRRGLVARSPSCHYSLLDSQATCLWGEQPCSLPQRESLTAVTAGQTHVGTVIQTKKPLQSESPCSSGHILPENDKRRHGLHLALSRLFALKFSCMSPRSQGCLCTQQTSDRGLYLWRFSTRVGIW